MPAFHAEAVAVQALLFIRLRMSSNPDPLTTARKRLAWRASRRGIKEMDILVGGFADANLPTMSAVELVIFERLLDIPDQQLLSWVTRQEDVPDEFRIPMLMQLLSFRPAP
jgi:antitoxin CptB